MNVCKTWSGHKHGFGCDTQCCGLEEIMRVPILLMTALTEPGERSYCSNSYTVMDIGVTDATHKLNAWPTKKDYIRMVWVLKAYGFHFHNTVYLDSRLWFRSTPCTVHFRWRTLRWSFWVFMLLDSLVAIQINIQHIRIRWLCKRVYKLLHSIILCED